MADKAKAGQPIPRSAALWNKILGAADAYGAGRLEAPAGPPAGSSLGEVIKIKNSSGDQIALGEVLEIDGFLLTDVHKDYLWFDGDTPDTTRPFAIAMQDIPSGSIDRAKVSGVCVAKVDVTDEDHNYAAVEDGEVVLQSALSGPVRILYKPSGTGEALCAVLIQTGSGGGRKWRVTLNEAFGDTTAYYAAADLLELDGTDTGRDVNVYDPLGIFASLTGNEGMYVTEQVAGDGTVYFIPDNAPCPGS